MSRDLHETCHELTRALSWKPGAGRKRKCRIDLGNLQGMLRPIMHCTAPRRMATAIHRLLCRTELSRRRSGESSAGARHFAPADESTQQARAEYDETGSIGVRPDGMVQFFLGMLKT